LKTKLLYRCSGFVEIDLIKKMLYDNAYDIGENNGVSVITKSIGHHSHWGFSSSFDILEALKIDDSIDCSGILIC
jgi:hypothetical protein